MMDEGELARGLIVHVCVLHVYAKQVPAVTVGKGCELEFSRLLE